MKTRLETMSKLHCFAFIAVFLGTLLIVFGASFQVADMLIYNTGDSFTCATLYDPGNPTLFSQVGMMSDTYKGACLDAMHRDGNSWLGRVHNLGLEN